MQKDIYIYICMCVCVCVCVCIYIHIAGYFFATEQVTFVQKKKTGYFLCGIGPLQWGYVHLPVPGLFVGFCNIYALLYY